METPLTNSQSMLRCTVCHQEDLWKNTAKHLVAVHNWSKEEVLTLLTSLDIGIGKPSPTKKLAPIQTSSIYS